ncbi:amino acid ABC transporter ATP-binding protein, partial [Mesorhizobium sp. M00.F.Ca.ET.149.01.1.1]
VVSGLVEVGELKDTAGEASSGAPLPAIKAGSLEVRDLDMAYGELQVLKQIRLKIEPGTVTCVIGPSGSGKSTLLRCLNRLVEPKAGDVLLDGRSEEHT